jgi:DNA-binding NarL/FixJ family response regulator
MAVGNDDTAPLKRNPSPLWSTTLALRWEQPWRGACRTTASNHFPETMTRTLDTRAQTGKSPDPTVLDGGIGASAAVPAIRRRLTRLRAVPGGEPLAFDRARSTDVTRDTALSKTHLLIVGGDALLRAGLRMLLETDGRIVVAGEATTAEGAVAAARRLSPDVVLLDAGTPGLDCVEVTSRMVSATGTAVMLLIPSERDERVFATLRAGAGSVVVRDTEPSELVRAVDALADGGARLSPSLTRRLINELASRPVPASQNRDLLDELSAREREVMTLVGNGLSNDEIAERLVVSPATAKTHVSRAMVKLRVRARAQLVVLAYEAGLVVPGGGARIAPDEPLALAR